MKANYWDKDEDDRHMFDKRYESSRDNLNKFRKSRPGG